MICNVFKPKRRAGEKLRVARLYSGRYRLDGEGKATTVPLHTTDKQVATERLRKIINEREREKEGLLPNKALREAGARTLNEHLNDFLAAKAAVNRDARYLYELKNRVIKLMKECRWNLARDITAESFVAWRNTQKRSDKTLNEYLTSARSLLNWMEAKGRLLHNPLKTVEAPSTRDVQVRPRRAFTDNEMKNLLALAGKRRIVYLASAMTGLRRGELAQLQRGDFALDAERPRVVVRAVTTKNHKQAIIPLHWALVAELRAHLSNVPAGSSMPLFADLMPTMDEFRADLAKAEIPFIDESGRRADFHSLRHTFCTNLQRAGVNQRVLMELMRHSDRRLSDRVYTDAALLGTNEAVQKLAGFVGENDTQIDTQNLGADGLFVSQPVTKFELVDGSGKPINAGFRRDLAPLGTKGRETANGARYRVRTCDPYRVKVVLYH